MHDGGLLLLLSIILRKHKKWQNMPLRVFVVCSSQDKPETLESTVSAFLYAMRITARLKVRHCRFLQRPRPTLPPPTPTASDCY